MTWCANQIYAAASPEMVAAFRENEFFSARLYQVTDFGGLLVVAPEIAAATGDSESDGRDLSVGGKWSALTETATRATTPIFVPADKAADPYPFGLFRVLKGIQQKTQQAIVYYYCCTWGGDVETEIAWVFDQVDHVLEFVDPDQVCVVTPVENTIIHADVFGRAVEHLGVHLPTRFFAPHQRTFDWKRYRDNGSTEPRVHPNAPLQGVTLEAMVTALHARYGWDELARVVPIRCFQFDPSVKSSLTFLRRTPWARTQVAQVYLNMTRARR